MSSKSLEDHVLAIICSVFDAYSAALFLPDENGQTHSLAASFSLGDSISEHTQIQYGKGLVGRIIASRKPLIVSNFDREKISLDYYQSEREEDIKAFMGYPVPTGGVLCVDSKRQYSFTEKDEKILRLFAELISLQHALGDSGVNAAIPRYFAELSIIQELRNKCRRWPDFLKNFLRSISAATEFEYCAFATLQESGDHYCLECESVPLLLSGAKMLRLPLGNGLVGWVFRNPRTIYAEDGGLAPSTALFGKLPDMPDFPAAICMPVMVNRVCKGVLCLANTEPRAIEESLRSFVRMAVDHLSLFLENLYLKNRLQTYLPKATLQREGSCIYDPDTAPPPRKTDTDI